jgi:hypothetical protein
MGMADARCTNYVSSRLYNDMIMVEDAHLDSFDKSTEYRAWLQSMDPDTFFGPRTCSVFDYKEDYQYPR